MAVYMKEEDRAKIPSIVNIKGQGYKVYSETREERALKKTARKENREIKKAPKLEKKKEIAKSRKEMEERRSFADVAAGRNQSKDEQDEEGMSKTGTEEESEEEKEPAQEEARRENVAPSPVGLEDGVTVHGAQCRRWRGRRRGRRRTRSLLQRTRDHNDQNHKDQIKWTPTKQTTNKQTTKQTTTINNNNKQTHHITGWQRVL